LPLPVKYRIRFGEPLWFDGDPHDDEARLGDKVSVVRDAIDAMLQEGLENRGHVFW
jgi:hypothetical protein